MRTRREEMKGLKMKMTTMTTMMTTTATMIMKTKMEDKGEGKV